MKKVLLLVGLFIGYGSVWGQTLSQKLKTAFAAFEKDSQMRYGTASLYVIDANTGQVVFDKNSRMGLAPASTQKVIIAATAYELLGKGFVFNTILNGKPSQDGSGYLLQIKGTGDPTLGSWRYTSTIDSVLLRRWAELVRKETAGSPVRQLLVVDRPTGDIVSVPGGYVWDDMGNYYGSGWSWLNWRENQYDLFLQSGATGTRVGIKGTYPNQDQVQFNSQVVSGAPGSGDNAYIFCPPFSNLATIKGSIPPQKDSFIISGASPDPGHTLGMEFLRYLHEAGVDIDPQAVSTSRLENKGSSIETGYKTLVEHRSPSLDSIIYWYLKKSVNLYGEALLQSMPVEAGSSLDLGARIKVVQGYWAGKGINPGELNLYDGSGLSPANRVTTHAQVEILRYARKQVWFPAYLQAFPQYNGMTIKSGTIGDVKGYAGYHKAKNGKEYIFSFLVNNYNGSSGAIVKKMYQVLDLLK